MAGHAAVAAGAILYVASVFMNVFQKIQSTLGQSEHSVTRQQIRNKAVYLQWAYAVARQPSVREHVYERSERKLAGYINPTQSVFCHFTAMSNGFGGEPPTSWTKHASMLFSDDNYLEPLWLMIKDLSRVRKLVHYGDIRLAEAGLTARGVETILEEGQLYGQYLQAIGIVMTRYCETQRKIRGCQSPISADAQSRWMDKRRR